VLNGALQFVGRHSVGQKSAGCGRAESPDFRPGLPGFVEDRGQICFSRGSSALFPSWARPEREREKRTVVHGSYGVVFSFFARAILLCSHPSWTCSQLLLMHREEGERLASALSVIFVSRIGIEYRLGTRRIS